MMRKQYGFTLLELMTTVAIIGVLSAVGVPIFSTILGKIRLNDGKGDVYTVMNQQERYYLNNLSYTDNVGNGGLGFKLTDGVLLSPEGFFEMTATECIVNGSTAPNVSNCVRIVATGNGKVNNTIYWLQSNGEKSDNLD